MAVLRIAKMGNPVLLKAAAPVEDPSAPEIRRLAADMQETLEDIGASGLAAPQVFASLRVVVYRVIASRIPPGSGLEPRPWTVMVNPVITPKSQAKTPVWERCLSIPGLHGKVPRYSQITISYQDLHGRMLTHDAYSSWAALLLMAGGSTLLQITMARHAPAIVVTPPMRAMRLMLEPPIERPL